MTTESTQSLEQMQAEIAALKEQRIQELEMATAQRELDQLKSGKLPVEPVTNNAAIAAEQIKDIKLARVRQGLNGLAHFVAGPIASVYYGSKTGYWMPTLAATGVAVIGLPLALVDMGLTFALAAPVTSCLLMCNQSSEKRRQLGILLPEQADAMMSEVTRF
jgi:hypothetical protein